MNNDWVYDYLMHSGRKGMRWGVRLFQNPDGSLTPLGRLRYLKGDGTLTKAGDKAYRQAYIDTYDYAGAGDSDAVARSLRTMSELKKNAVGSPRQHANYYRQEYEEDRNSEVTKSKVHAIQSMKDTSPEGQEKLGKILEQIRTADKDYNRRINTIKDAILKLDDGSPLTKEEQKSIKIANALEKYYAEIDDTYERAIDKQMAKAMAPDKKASLKYAREQDRYNLDFLEAVQNEVWINDKDRMLKEYERFFDNGGFRGYRRDLEDRRKKGKTEPQP